MRSKIGTQSRLAAHILALFLLILLLVYLAPPQSVVTERQETAQAAAPEEPAATPAPAEPAAEPAPGPVPEPAPEPKPEPVQEIAVLIEQIAPRTLPPVQPLSLRPPVETVAEVPEEIPEVPAEPAPAVPEEPTEPATPEVPEEPVAAEAPEAIEEPETPVEEQKEELPVQPQPDESGALVVAPADAGAAERVTAPLKNAHLEVLGDGVYWLAPGHDLTEELAAIPELARLIILAPLPGYTMSGLGSVEPEVISAALPDCTPESAERFVSLVAEGAQPVVAAALPGARGAAFFKAAYLLKIRHLTEEDVLRKIEADLAEAGDAREEVLRSLSLLLAPPEEPEPAEETMEEPAEAEAPAANGANNANETNDTGGN